MTQQKQEQQWEAGENRRHFIGLKEHVIQLDFIRNKLLKMIHKGRVLITVDLLKLIWLLHRMEEEWRQGVSTSSRIAMISPRLW